MNTAIDYTVDFTLLFLLFYSAYTDLRYRKIFNAVTLPALLIGLVCAAVTQFPDTLLNRLLGFGIGFGIFFLMFAAGYMGGGDVKLAAAIGMLKGYPFIIDAMFFGILMGGGYAVIVLLNKGLLWKNIRHIGIFLFNLIIPGRQAHVLKMEESIKIPYGVSISLGALSAWVLHNTTDVQCFFLGL